MKPLVDFLSELKSLGISLASNGDRLVCNAPKQVVTEEIRRELGARKAEILTFLRDSRAIGASPAMEDAAAEVPLSHSQQRLWFIHQLDLASPAYNIVASLWLTGERNEEALDHALRTILERHESLRTGFHASNGKSSGRIVDAGNWTMKRVAIERPPDGSGSLEEETQRIARSEARRPFDLERAPLFRATLLKLSPQRALLLLVVHHIVADGWSLGILCQELMDFYRSFAGGEPVSLAELPAQFRDYVNWEQDAGNRAAEQQMPFWLEQLSGELPITELPLDKRRPSAQTFDGRRIPLQIEEDLAQRIRELSIQTNATVFMILLAAFQALLFRYTGMDDVLVGSGIANRPRQEFSGLIGFFVNTLVLRTDLSGNPSFRELLDRVRQAATSAYAHQDVPFDRLVEAIRPERAANRNPLVQITFTLQNVPMPKLSLVNLEAEAAELDPGIARTDLSVEVWPQGRSYRCDFEYNTDLFEERTIRQLQSHYLRFLEVVLADPAIEIARVPLLSREERRTIFEEWNRTTVDFEDPAFVQQSFERQAARAPEATALTFGDARLSYRELNRRANQLAHYLVHLGVKPDSRVAICVERSFGMIVGLLAVLKAGGAYVPLDATYPVERLHSLIADSSPAILLVQGRTGTLFSGENPMPQILDLAAASPPWTEFPETDPDPASLGLAPDHLAYIIYTSGSTGRPKGAMVMHRGLRNLAAAQRSTLGAGSNSRVLQFASFSFDACIFEVTMALCVGASLNLATSATALIGEGLIESIAQNRITHALLPPSVLATLPEDVGLDPLHTLLVGGEAMSEALARKWHKRLRLINAYGPTETTVVATWYEVKAITEEKPVPIGRPLANTRVYLLDTQGEPVPVGVAGELCIGGIQVGRGYLNRPELTEQRFVPDPFSSEPGARMYKTGDLARWLPDGAIEFLGRNDFQVKIRGFRIELGEIETHLTKHPGVREVIVVGREDAPGDTRLVAYYTYSGKQAPEGDALRVRLMATLPEYMIPSAFVALPEFPLTSNAKIDRKGLPAPDGSARRNAEAVVEPGNAVERTLVRIWSNLLRIRPVGIHDNFFDLGGHSLLALQVISHIHEQLQVKLSVTAIFQNPTVASLGELISAQIEGLPPSSSVAIQQSSQERYVHPLSRSQQRLWFLDQLNPGDAVYNITIPVRLAGALSTRALESALKSIVERHESLRTSFFEREGAPYARVEQANQWTMKLADLSDAAPHDLDATFRRAIEEEAGKAFDLSRAPLFRASLLRIGPQDHVLIVVVHHIVFDGWSMGIFANEVAAQMQASLNNLENRSLSLPPPRVQFRDFVAWELEQDASREQEMEYWKKQLAGELPPLELPIDYQRPPVQSFRGAHSRVTIPEQLVERLERLGREQKATYFMVLLAAFKVLLLRYSRQEDILVGTPTAGRVKSDFEGVIGFFVNNLVLRTDLGGNPTFTELLQRVGTTTLNALEHQSTPFDQLVEELQPERGLDRSPIFQVLFALQNLPIQKITFASLEMSPVEIETFRARYDLAVDVYLVEDEYKCSFEYNTDLFETETIQQMQRHYLRLLEAIASDPHRRIADLPMLHAEERGALIEDWNRTARELPAHRTVPAWFRAQAAATPEATAVQMGATALSYRELDAQSEMLANLLRGKGVRREIVVGLYLARGLNMVVALLAVLKAGGAYLPLDPAFPADRIQFLLNDADVGLILTEETIRATLPTTGADLLLLDRLPESSALSRADFEPEPADLAYLIYTSGSTGAPKGTEITHGALVNLLASMLREPGLRQSDTLVAVTTLSFDIAGLELFGPLVCGAKLVLAAREQALDPVALADLLRREEGTVLQATPSTWRLLVDSGWMGKSNLRMWCGGEALPPELADSLLARGRELWNLYGPTETTIWSAAHRVGAGEDPILIGGPIDNTRMYILDAQQEPVPIGVTGELYIAGDGVARGYWKRPELTASKFLPDPFAKDAGARMYRTGDLARYRRDGQIQLLGRIDQQIKLRGHRIELGEIESVMERHPSVGQAVVTVNGAGSQQRLIAYLKQAEETPAGELRAWLQKRLPEYMVPAMFLSLRELPLTPNGKVDRKRLPAPEESVREISAETVVPRTQVERTLARIWSDILKVEPVGVRDNFFDLGGQSLLLIKVHARLRQEFNTQIPVVDLFRYPTIESMAAHLDRQFQAVHAAEVNS